mmetsp:Transcript_112054/g.304169  ORF Transcript_112054/g.304169 Transcript_112054/m.304169 type:complete len:212 (-) Transcript_112054:837-1472(-)
MLSLRVLDRLELVTQLLTVFGDGAKPRQCFRDVGGVRSLLHVAQLPQVLVDGCLVRAEPALQLDELLHRATLREAVHDGEVGEVVDLRDLQRRQGLRATLHGRRVCRSAGAGRPRHEGALPQQRRARRRQARRRQLRGGRGAGPREAIPRRALLVAEPLHVLARGDGQTHGRIEVRAGDVGQGEGQGAERRSCGPDLSRRAEQGPERRGEG